MEHRQIVDFKVMPLKAISVVQQKMTARLQPRVSGAESRAPPT